MADHLDHDPWAARPFTVAEEARGEIAYRALPGVGSAAGGVLVEVDVAVPRQHAVTRGRQAFLHVDLVRHVWGVQGHAPAPLVSQHGTHAVFRLDPPPAPPPSGGSWRWTLTLELGFEPAWGVSPEVACRGHAAQLRKVSDVQDGAYLELRHDAEEGNQGDVLVPLAIGRLSLGFEDAGPAPEAPERICPPGLPLRLPPPHHLAPAPTTPAFEYRAVLLDVARHFHPVRDVKWLIDRAADLRLNVLHLHLTDDAGWRVEISRYPQLTLVGAWRGHGLPVPSLYGSGPRRYGGFYSREDVREIVEHAAGRGVEVVPEIDIPGHSFATLRALPHLAETPEKSAAAVAMGSFPHNCLNPALPQTLEFLTHVLDEVVDMFTPCTRVHLGCDEVPRGAFAEMPACRELAEREGYLSPEGPGGLDETALVAHLMAPLQARLLEKGVEVMGWEEAAYGYSPPAREGGGSCSGSGGVRHSSYLRPPATVCAWKGRGEAGPTAARAGFDVVMMPAVHTYLDLAESDHPESPGLYWAAPCVTPDDAAKLDPLAGFPESASGTQAAAAAGDGGGCRSEGSAGDEPAERRGRVVGVGAALWGEVCRNREDMAARLFPRRLAEVAKVAWMGKGTGTGAGSASRRVST